MYRSSGPSPIARRMDGLKPTKRGIGLPTNDSLTSDSRAGVPATWFDDKIVALRAIVEGTARSTGDVFFESLVRHLASAIGVSYAFVAEFARSYRAFTLLLTGAKESLGRTSSTTWRARHARTLCVAGCATTPPGAGEVPC